MQDETKLKRIAGIARFFVVPRLTRARIVFAFVVSGITDGLQLALGPIGWVFLDEALDAVAMVLTCAALGFHMLLLPTFVIELIPVADMLPTWTGCTAAVVMLRRRAEAPLKAPPVLPSAVNLPKQIEAQPAPPPIETHS
jgi:hypothetical protein